MSKQPILPRRLGFGLKNALVKHSYIYVIGSVFQPLAHLVEIIGLEPIRIFIQRILSPLCLPIPSYLDIMRVLQAILTNAERM